MGLFRRTPRGKHALGAAVRGIPSGPLVAPPGGVAGLALQAVSEPPAPMPPAPVVEATTPVVEPTEPPAAAAPAPAVDDGDLAASIAVLVASGEAWAADDATTVPLPPVTAAPRPVPAQRSAVAPQPVARPLPVPPEPVQSPAPNSASSRAALESALAELLPPPVAAPHAGVDAPRLPVPRVQLGFRDGTSTDLAPDSEQSLALQQLARDLTSRHP
jgi:hypothetical protein